MGRRKGASNDVVQVGVVRAVGQCSRAFGSSSVGACSSSLTLDTDEAMSASSKMAQDADDAMLWQRGRKGIGGALVDLEGKMEKLEVVRSDKSCSRRK